MCSHLNKMYQNLVWLDINCNLWNINTLNFFNQNQYNFARATYITLVVTITNYDSVRPHRRQPTRLPHPWDSPGKNTGVGCHFLLQWMKVKSESEVAQSCLTPSNPMDCSLPGSSIHGIFQARVLERVAIAFSDKQLEILTNYMLHPTLVYLYIINSGYLPRIIILEHIFHYIYF